MDEKFNPKNLFQDKDLKGKTPTSRRAEKIQKFTEHDKIVTERRAILVEKMKGLIESEKLIKPTRKFSSTLLQTWIDTYPEFFFGHTTAAGLLKTYFFSSIDNLKV